MNNNNTSNQRFSIIKRYNLIFIAVIAFSCFSINNLKAQTNKIDSFTNSTLVLSNILTILKDSLDDYGDIVDQGPSKPALLQNFQHPIKLNILIDNDQLFLVYECWITEEMVTDTKSYQYIIPIASLKDDPDVLFGYSLSKKQLLFNYKGIVYINASPFTKGNITVKITTKVSEIAFQRIVNDFHKIGL